MQPINRRSFLQSAFFAGGWRKKPPAAYLAELAPLMRAASVPGAVIGALEGGKPAWIAPLGVLTAGGSAPVTPSTLFQAASLTKQVTAYAAFALRAQGKLDFDRPLVQYVDDLADPVARTVTARHVLSHSSGFPNWRFPRSNDPDPKLVPAFPPGTRYQYSGEGFYYLQRVMEKVSGEGFGALCRALVFQPLGMAASTLVWDPQTLARTAQPHNGRGELRRNRDAAARQFRDYAAKAGKPVEALRHEDAVAVAQTALPDNLLPNAAASLVTSAEEYARFLAAAIGNPELPRRQTRVNEFIGWGLGWGIQEAGGRTHIFQWGDNPGFKNIVFAEPASGDALFVFTNGDGGARVYDRVVTHATGRDQPVLFWL